MAATKSQAKTKSKPTNSNEWPGGFGIYERAKKAAKVNIETLAVLWLAAVVLGGIFSLGKTGGDLLGFLVDTLATTALTITLLAGVAGKKITAGDAITRSWPLYVNMLLSTLLSGFIAVISFLALIVPFFFVAPRLILVSFYIVDKKLEPVEAVKASWEATKDQLGKIYGIVGVNLAILLLAFTIVGIPFAIYFWVMYTPAYALLYKHLQKS